MSELPFTKRERRKLSYQYGYGHRPISGWGSGDLPAPFAEGDIVRLVDVSKLDDRCDGEEGDFFVVASGFSIGDGDEWYFRVDKGEGTSDRLHIGYVNRRGPGWGDKGDVDYMAAFELVDTSDPDGLAARERMLSDGWTMPDDEPNCFCRCHQEPIAGSSQP